MSASATSHVDPTIGTTSKKIAIGTYNDKGKKEILRVLDCLKADDLRNIMLKIDPSRKTKSLLKGPLAEMILSSLDVGDTEVTVVSTGTNKTSKTYKIDEDIFKKYMDDIKRKDVIKDTFWYKQIIEEEEEEEEEEKQAQAEQTAITAVPAEPVPVEPVQTPAEPTQNADDDEFKTAESSKKTSQRSSRKPTPDPEAEKKKNGTVDEETEEERKKREKEEEEKKTIDKRFEELFKDLDKTSLYKKKEIEPTHKKNVDVKQEKPAMGGKIQKLFSEKHVGFTRKQYSHESASSKYEAHKKKIFFS